MIFSDWSLQAEDDTAVSGCSLQSEEPEYEADSISSSSTAENNSYSAISSDSTNDLTLTTLDADLHLNYTHAMIDELSRDSYVVGYLFHF